MTIGFRRKANTAPGPVVVVDEPAVKIIYGPYAADMKHPHRSTPTVLDARPESCPPNEVLDRAKDTVRVAQAFGWQANKHTAAMGRRVEEATRHLSDAVSCLATKDGRPGDHAELAIKAARAVEHGLLEAFAALPRDGSSWDRTAAIEVYRGYSDLEHALLRVADRTWYAVLRAM